LELLNTQDDGSESGIHLISHRPGDFSADFSDWPASMQPLEMLVTKVEVKPELPPLDSPLSLGLDRRGRRTQVSNAEMADIFSADQAIRAEMEAFGGWEKVQTDKAFMKRWKEIDAKNLIRTNELLVSGALKSGLDYERAAFVFQHGSTAEDYLKAHHLAVIAISLGNDGARWISAATLDRYLLTIGKPQIYGTQFSGSDLKPSPPFDAALISDAERQALNVPPLQDQKP
jgi:hypothetical protein